MSDIILFLKNHPLIIYFTLLFVFFSLTFYIYFFSYSEYEKTLCKHINTIINTNSSVNGLLIGQDIDIKKSKEQLPVIIDNLKNTKSKIEKLTTPKKHKAKRANLLQGLTNNINMYNQLLSILTSPEAMDINVSRDNLKKFKDNTWLFYSKSCSSKIKISLPNTTEKYINSSIYFSEQLVKLKNNKTIEDSALLDFIQGIDAAFHSVQKSKIDFSTYISDTSSKKKSYTEIIKIANNTKEQLKDIKMQLDKISIPSKSNLYNPIEIYNSLKATLIFYDSYLDSIIQCVSKEKTYFEILYTESKTKYNTFIQEYEKFIREYNTFKNK